MQDSQTDAAGTAQPVEGKKKRKWPWIVGGLIVVGLIGSALDGGDEAGDTETEDTTTNTVQEAPTEEAVEAPAEENAGDSPAGESNLGEQWEEWFLSDYDPPSWDTICTDYGTFCNVVDVHSFDDNTIVLITNLSQEGEERAEQMVTAIQNNAELMFPGPPQSVRDNARYVQVWDLQGNVLANGGVEFAD